MVKQDMPFLHRKMLTCHDVFVFRSIGCGIGYGYLHRIPLRDEAHRSKEAPVITPASDGFSEVYVQ